MMVPAARIAASLILALALASAALAQGAGFADADKTLNALAKTLDTVEREIPRAQDEAELAALRDTVGAALAQARTLALALTPRREEAEALRAALGDAAEGAAEPADVARERRDLDRLIGELDTRIQRVRLITVRGEALTKQLSKDIREASAARLLARTGAPFAAETLALVGADLARIEAGVLAELAAAVPEAETGLAGPVFAILAAGGTALFLGFFVRRAALARLARWIPISGLTRSRRLVFAVLSAIVRALLPAVAIGIVYLTVRQVIPLDGVLLSVFNDIAIASLGGVAVHALASAMLAPATPSRRVLPVSDRTALVWPPALAVLAGLAVIERALNTAAGAFAENPESALILGAPAILLAAVVLVVLGLFGVDRDAGSWRLLRLPVIAALAATPVLMALGYFVLAQFLTVRIVLSTGVLVALWLVFQITQETIHSLIVAPREEPQDDTGRARLKEAQLRAWWLLVGAGGVLLLAAAGILALVWGADARDFGALLAAAVGGVTIGGVTLMPIDVLLGIAVLAAGIWLTGGLQRVLETQVLPRTRLERGAQAALKAGFGYLGVTLAALTGILAAGFDLTNLAIIAGALSVGIGFGLQTVVSNFVSGLILLAERPFQVGDWITSGEHEGIVRNVKVRATEIQTFDNAVVTVPNSELVTGRVLNWTHRDVTGRLILKVGVAYGSDPNAVRELLLACAYAHEDVLAYPAPFVLFTSFGANALDFELRCMLRDVTRRLTVNSDLHFAIEKALREKGIAVPFPQRDVHVKGLERLEQDLAALAGRAAKAAE